MMQSLQESEDKKENILRALDRAEANFWLYDRVSSMNFAVMAELEGPISIERLQKAMDKVQSFHTNAQVSITQKEEETTFLAFAHFPDRKIPFRKYNTPDWKNHLANEAIRLFSLDEAPLIRCLFYELENKNYALAFVFNHSIADGRSGCYFLLDVLKEYDVEAENFATFSPERFGSMMELAPLFPEGAVPSLSPGKPDSLPNFARKKEESNPRILSFSIGKNTLQGLLQKAKSNRTSLHGAIGAAQAVAFKKLFVDSSSVAVLLATPADLRPYLKELVPMEFLGLYITLLTTRMELESDFWELARTVTTDLRNKLANSEGRFFYEVFPPVDQFLKREESMRVLSSLLSRNPQASVLSNVGVLPDRASEQIHIKNISFTVHPTITQTLFTTVTTFRGESTVNVNYDSNRWANEDIELYLKEFQEIITRESNL